MEQHISYKLDIINKIVKKFDFALTAELIKKVKKKYKNSTIRLMDACEYASDEKELIKIAKEILIEVYDKYISSDEYYDKRLSITCNMLRAEVDNEGYLSLHLCPLEEYERDIVNNSIANN